MKTINLFRILVERIITQNTVFSNLEEKSFNRLLMKT